MGEPKIKVLSECGDPLFKEITGYTEPERGKESIKVTISQWTYGPWRGYYYVLTFNGGILAKIDSVRK